jgi:hypothetical protein
MPGVPRREVVGPTQNTSRMTHPTTSSSPNLVRQPPAYVLDFSCLASQMPVERTSDIGEWLIQHSPVASRWSPLREPQACVTLTLTHVGSGGTTCPCAINTAHGKLTKIERSPPGLLRPRGVPGEELCGSKPVE